MHWLCFGFVSLSFLLFFSNHAEARLGESYRESVDRYEKAGFKMERSTAKTPPNDESKGWAALEVSRDTGVTELTWFTGATHEGQNFYLVSITQVFYGEWPYDDEEKPYEDVLHCIDISYRKKTLIAELPRSRRIQNRGI